MVRRPVKINWDGLEEHPIAMIIQKASQYSSTVHIEIGDNRKINAKSIMGMTLLSVYADEDMVIVTEGKDEEIAANEMELYLSKQ